MYTMLRSYGIDGGAGAGNWDSTQSMWVITAIIYFLCELPGILGIIGFGIACVKRQKKSDYFEAGEQYKQEQ
jgi:hypothetical protein